jgi:hypothetical protein
MVELRESEITFLIKIGLLPANAPKTLKTLGNALNRFTFPTAPFMRGFRFLGVLLTPAAVGIRNERRWCPASIAGGLSCFRRPFSRPPSRR